MFDYQHFIFNWIVAQHWSMALVMFGAGLLYAFQGFRMFRFLLGVSSVIIGLLLGSLLAGPFGLPEMALQLACAGFLTAVSVFRIRLSVVLTCGLTWFALGHYLMAQIDAPPVVALAVAALCGGFGGLFAHLCHRPMKVVLTTLQGVLMLIVGWVGLSDDLMPSVGETFRAWAESQALLVPILLVMLEVMAYSIQANAQKGHMMTGNL